MAYQYRPLIKGCQIRLLEMKPPSDPTTNLFSIQIYDLSRLPPYEAISYTWGKPDFKFSMVCDEDRNCLPITTNCATMLRYLWLEATSVRRVWIDQICINQKDTHERNDQVLLMTKIYSGARQVIAWIGECGEEQKRCLDLVAQFPRTKNIFVEAKSYTTQWNGEKSIETSGGPRLEAPEVKPWLDESGWAQATLETIICRPYFRRMWIVQEVIVAPRVMLKCGNCCLDMQHLFDVCLFIRLISHRTDIRPDHFIISLCSYRIEYEEHGTLGYDGLEKLMSNNQVEGRSVTDNRDRIYALRGICSALEKNTPPPDYSKSDVDIFMETAKASVVTDGGRLSILSADRSLRHGADLPTWCPDYGHVGDVGVVHVLSSKRLWEKSKSPKSLSVFDGNRLIVRGRSVDSITTLSEGVTWENHWERLTEELETWRSWFSFMKPATSSYDGKEPMHIAFWSTLFNDTSDWLKPELAPKKEEAERLLNYVEILHGLMMRNDIEEELLCMSRWMDLSLAFDVCDALSCSRFMRACITEDKFFGLVPSDTKMGDMVVYIEGADKLYLLRPQNGSSGVFTVVGSCYVYGLSKGEKYPMEESDMREIVIV